MQVFNKRIKAKALWACTAGSTALAFAAMSPFILAGIGYSTEVTFWELRGRQLQNTLDVAAYASATQLRGGKSTSVMSAVSRDILQNSNFEDAETTLTVQSPPAAGAYAGDSSAVRLLTEHKIRRSFTSLFAEDDFITIHRTSTARVFDGRPACLLALHPSAGGAVTFSGSSTVTLSGCDVATNSIASDAIDVAGSTTVVTECASAVGHIDNNGGMTYTDCDKGIEEAPVTADPYANLAEPTVPVTCADKTGFTGSGTARIPSGQKFCNGGGIRGDIVLEAGIHYLSGGTWRINSSANVTGDDIMIYLTNGAELDINGGADVDFTASTTGTYKGVLIYVDRDDSSSHLLNGGSSMLMTGAVYAPSANIDYNGSNDTAASCVQIVASQIALSGNSAFSSACASATGVDALVTAQKVLLVE